LRHMIWFQSACPPFLSHDESDGQKTRLFAICNRGDRKKHGCVDLGTRIICSE
jgi:hypothetical protein